MNATQQESIDFFNSNVESEIQQGIIDALDESDDYEIEIEYDAADRKFIHSQNLKGTFTKSDDIFVARIEPWTVLDIGLDISVEEAEAMTEDEKKYISGNCANDWIDQYDNDIEQALKLIPGYEE